MPSGGRRHRGEDAHRPVGRTRCPPQRPSGTGLGGDCFSPLRFRPVFSSCQRVVTRTREERFHHPVKTAPYRGPGGLSPPALSPPALGTAVPHWLHPGRLARRLRGSLALVQGRLAETLDVLTAICIIIWLHVTHAREARGGKRRPALPRWQSQRSAQEGRIGVTPVVHPGPGVLGARP